MSSFARLRHHPDYAEFFELVHPLFWLVLVWQLTRAIGQLAEKGSQEAVIDITWWGRVTIAFFGDSAPNPSAYKPIAPSRKAWDDPCWSTDVPQMQRHAFPRLRRESGVLRRVLKKWACALPAHADTS